MISAPNRIHPLSNADLHDAAHSPASTALGAVNLLDAVRADRRQRWLSTLALVASVTQHLDLDDIPREPANV